MNKKEYLQKLASELRGLEKSQQREILQEIEDLITDSACPDAELEERFGTPQELAVSYGKIPSTPAIEVVSGIAKKLVFGIGLLVLALIATAMYFYWSNTNDVFDYSDESNPELTLGSSDWRSFPYEQNTSFTIKHAQVVVYWHEQSDINWKCADPDTGDLAMSLTIDSNRCYLFIPKQTININSTEAQIVLVAPQANLNLDIHHTEVSIAPNDQQFQLEIDKTQSKIEPFPTNNDSDVLISVKAKQSKVSHYNY